jgi:hypothetical protein
MEILPDNTIDIRQILQKWLENRLNEKALTWLKSAAGELMDNPEDWQLYTFFSTTPRHTGKELLQLDKGELEEAERVRKGWKPANWTADQAGRTLLLLSYAVQGEEQFLDKIEKIFVTSDLGEAVALYQALPVFPFPGRFKERASEGVRSNITPVFEAVALNNPYPMEYLEEGAWNQIVLKALFVGSPLYKIMGIDKRANATLAKILVEYAHERWSAGRNISPELWRAVGPFITEEYLPDLVRALDHPDPIQKRAAILALSASMYNPKEKLLHRHQDILDDIKENNITWDEIGRKFESASH